MDDTIIAFAPAGITSYTLPDGIKFIKSKAFTDCDKLEDIVLPSSIIDIGAYAFWDCTKLKNISIPNGVQKIADFVFEGCSSLTNIVIPDSVSEIGMSFRSCKNLIEVEFGKNVKKIGTNSFQGCDKIKYIHCKSSTPPKLSDNAFVYVSLEKVYVPLNSVDAYKNNSSWSKFSSYIEGKDFEN